MGVQQGGVGLCHVLDGPSLSGTVWKVEWYWFELLIPAAAEIITTQRTS